MAKKVLLIYPPNINQIANINIPVFDKTIVYYPPLGLLYIATYLKSFNNYEVEILDSNIKRLSFREIRTEIEKSRPDIIGISAITHFWIDVLEIAKISKELFPNIKVIVGGPHAIIFPVTTVKNKFIDYAFRGEGEIGFKKLVDAIFENLPEEEISRIPGVASKLHVAQKKSDEDIELQVIENLNAIPFPDRNLLDISKYSSILDKKGTFTTLMTSRGCPFTCIFCNRLGKKFRAVSAENVIKEMKECLALGIRKLFIHDDTFTVDKNRVKQICQSIIEEGLKIEWEARSRVDCIDYELLKLMKQAGLSRMGFGGESGNVEVLANLRKGIKLKQVKEAFKWCKELKITTLADFMIGSPGENLKEIDDTLRFIKQIKPDYIQFCITCPYPATPLYKKLLEEGKIANDVWLEFAQNPTVNFTPPIASEYFNRQELETLVTQAYRKVYFSLPLIIRDIKKIKSPEMFFARVKSAISLLRSLYGN